MSLSFISVFDHGLEPSAAVLTLGFSGYFVPVHMDTAGLLTMVRQDSVDLQLSRVIIHTEQPVGIALIARRGWTSRLAAMSIVPDARGQGIGIQVVKQLLDEARTRGDKAMNLEAIEQNTPAVRLYEKSGFQTVRRLVGYVGQPQPGLNNVPLQVTDIREVAQQLAAFGPNDLPWQISAETLAQMGPPWLAFRSDSSYAVITNPAAPTINIRAILTLPEARRQGHATALLRALMARYPDKSWRVGPHFPEEIGGLFLKVGWDRYEITQWQMSIDL